jgi:hypothetical protein
MPVPEDQQPLIASLKKVAARLAEVEVPFALAGSFAVYARGGQPCDHDVDFLIREQDAEKVLGALAEIGLRTEIPPEGWLVKVFDDDHLIDLIYRPVQRPVTDSDLAEVDILPVNAVHMPVMSATVLMIHKMLTWSAHFCDFARGLPVARSPREQIDWTRVQRETADSPFADAFLVLLDRLDVISLSELTGVASQRRLKGVAG